MEIGRIVIIGGGIAGVSAAVEIRAKKVEAEIVMLSGEPILPYFRLGLTRYLAGEIKKESLSIYPESWYEQNNVKLLMRKKATRINLEAKIVEIDDGTEVSYDKLIIAAGASPIVPPVTGKNLKNVMTVRTVEDADLLLEKLKDTRNCICIGGGLLGLETAGAIRKYGVSVTLIEIAPWLMSRQLNRTASGYLKSYINSLGIEVMENVRVKEIFGADSCEGIYLENGDAVAGDLVVITAGIRPNVELPQKSGLISGKGLVVDEHMRTSDKSVFGAGDLVEVNGQLGGLWNVSQLQGKCAGLNAIGIDNRYEGIPRSHALKVLGLDVFSMGDLETSDTDSLELEKAEDDRYYHFVTRQGKITGSIIVGDRALSIKVKLAIEKKRTFPDDAFLDAEHLIKFISAK